MTLQEIKRQGEFTCNIAHLNRLCAKVKDKPWKVYDLIDDYGGMADTVTREAMFNYIADKYHDGDYDKVYKPWLNGTVRNYA